MDFKELMRIAAGNKERAKKECIENKRYSTQLPPPKKEQKSVNPNAVRAKLLQKEQEQKEKAAEEERKKQELLKIRAASQTDKKGKGKKDGSTTKTKSSPKETQRSKPEGSDRKSTSKHDREKYDDDEHEIRHKHFMEKVNKVAKMSRDDDESDDESDYESDEEPSKPVKNTPAPSKKKSVPKGPMSYEDLLKLAAERQKSGSQQGPSSNSERQRDDTALRVNKFSTSFHKNHKDKIEKHPVIGNGHLKEAAERYKKGSKKDPGQSDSQKPRQDHNQRPVIGNGHLKEAAEKYKKGSKKDSGPSNNQRLQAHDQRPVTGNERLKQAAEKYKPKTPRPETSRPSASKQSHDRVAPKQSPNSKNAVQSKITEHMRTKNKVAKQSKESRSSQSEPRRSVGEMPKKQVKRVVNDRDRHMPVDKDRRKQPPMKNERYGLGPAEKYRERPHSSHMDRDRPRSSGAEFRRPMAKKRPAPPVKMKAKHGRIVSDDESDYEEDGFIDDTPLEDEGADVSSYIKQIFGYDKSKYGYESDYALRFMDASYKDIAREEARSARLGMLEDLEDMRKEKEEMMRKSKKSKGGKGRR